MNNNNVTSDYEARPEYKKNDYTGWIERAKRQETKEKRIKKMIDGLKIGGIYMEMKHPASIKDKS